MGNDELKEISEKISEAIEEINQQNLNSALKKLAKLEEKGEATPEEVRTVLEELSRKAKEKNQEVSGVNSASIKVSMEKQLEAHTKMQKVIQELEARGFSKEDLISRNEQKKTLNEQEAKVIIEQIGIYTKAEYVLDAYMAETKEIDDVEKAIKDLQTERSDWEKVKDEDVKNELEAKMNAKIQTLKEKGLNVDSIKDWKNDKDVFKNFENDADTKNFIQNKRKNIAIRMNNHLNKIDPTLATKFNLVAMKKHSYKELAEKKAKIISEKFNMSEKKDALDRENIEYDKLSKEIEKEEEAKGLYVHKMKDATALNVKKDESRNAKVQEEVKALTKTLKARRNYLRDLYIEEKLEAKKAKATEKDNITRAKGKEPRERGPVKIGWLGRRLAGIKAGMNALRKKTVAEIAYTNIAYETVQNEVVEVHKKEGAREDAFKAALRAEAYKVASKNPKMTDKEIMSQVDRNAYQVAGKAKPTVEEER